VLTTRCLQGREGLACARIRAALPRDRAYSKACSLKSERAAQSLNTCRTGTYKIKDAPVSSGGDEERKRE
jgi:hypothetical protein